MLRNIPKILPPELVKTMMEMGHSDVLILADANFPGTAHAKKMIRMDGIMIPELLEAILQLFPLDNFIDNPNDSEYPPFPHRMPFHLPYGSSLLPSADPYVRCTFSLPDNSFFSKPQETTKSNKKRHPADHII